MKYLIKCLRTRGIIGFVTVAVYRMGNIIFYKIKIPVIKQLMWILYRVFDLVFVKVIGHADIPAQTKIGRGLATPHGGNGVIISECTVIGDNAWIYQQVTIGRVNASKDSPVIGDNVSIFAGAKVLGKIKIGNNVTIGANAVVLSDVPDNSIAVGVPARVLPKEK